MFADLPMWLNVILTAAAVVALGGGVFGYFKSSAGDRTLKLASEEIRLLNQRDERRQLEFEGCKQQMEIQKSTISLLTDTVTGASAIKELAEMIRLNHEEVVIAHRRVVKKLNGRARTTPAKAGRRTR